MQLHTSCNGDTLTEVYQRLQRIAQRLMLRERVGHTLGAADVVHEAWLRLLGSGTPPDHVSPLEFIRRCSRAMTEVLIDYARARHAKKRGRLGGPDAEHARVTPDHLEFVAMESPNEPCVDFDIVELRRVLSELEQLYPKRYSIVTLRFFGGMSTAAIARQLQLDESTVRRTWTATQEWLHKRLSARTFEPGISALPRRSETGPYSHRQPATAAAPAS